MLAEYTAKSSSGLKAAVRRDLVDTEITQREQLGGFLIRAAWTQAAGVVFGELAKPPDKAALTHSGPARESLFERSSSTCSSIKWALLQACGWTEPCVLQAREA
jgi:hypothetical protein